MNVYQQEALQERIFEGIDFSDQGYIRAAFEQSNYHLSLNKKDYALCLINAPLLPQEELFAVLDNPEVDENYKDAVLRTYSTRDSSLPPVLAQVIQDNKYCGTPGIIPSHVVDVTIGKGDMAVELPEVMVWQNIKPYVKRIKNAEAKGIEKELFKTLCYVYRLGMDDREVLTATINRGIEYKRIKVIQKSAAKKSSETKTIDELYMVDWFERAVKYCNSWNQVDILIHVYIEACTYGNTQPAISKQRIAEKAGVDRKVIRRLFERLEKAGILVEGPESTKEYDYKAGRPLSNPRIVNLNPSERGRWEDMVLRAAPDRSKEAKEKKAKAKTRVLANNGVWFDDAAKNADKPVAKTFDQFLGDDAPAAEENEPDLALLITDPEWANAEPDW